MRVRLAYDRGVQEADLPEGRFRSVRPPGGAPLADVPKTLAEALDHPFRGPSLPAFLKGRRRVLLVVSDATRRTGAETVLPLLRGYLDERGLVPPAVKIAIATGIHRPPTAEETGPLTGGGAFPGAGIVVHRADSPGDHIDFGVTAFGNRVRLNRVVEWADAIVALGGVGFHYFAGFSGGRKSLMPGLAAAETIAFNHRLVLEPDGSGRRKTVAVAALEGNPVHEDMEEALRRVGLDRVFLVNVSLDEVGRLAAIVCGHGIDAHREACRGYLQSHSVNLPAPADVVVAGSGGFPRDINMIQSHKVIEMGRYGLRPGGALVAVAACPEGMGHPGFFPWFRFRDERAFCRELTANYVINGQTAFALFEKTRRYRVILVSGLPDDAVRAMGMTPARRLQDAIDLAVGGLGDDFSGLVLPDAGTTFCLTGRPS
ncbi:MAG: nickel-dependent lactate racemase [Acidobacteria bacterium]|nr:nickel-dependent lactate racemase [Acidobacteriota bacterium]